MGNVTSRDPVTGVPMMKPLAERKKMYKQAEKAMPTRSKKALKTVSDLLEKVIKDVKDKQKPVNMDSYNQMQREIAFARLPDGRPDTKRIMQLNRRIQEKFGGGNIGEDIRRTFQPFTDIFRPAGLGLPKSRKGNSKAKARGQMVSELMKKEGLTLGQASKKLASMNK
jgi:hypothetical protein